MCIPWTHSMYLVHETHMQIEDRVAAINRAKADIARLIETEKNWTMELEQMQEARAAKRVKVYKLSSVGARGEERVCPKCKHVCTWDDMAPCCPPPPSTCWEGDEN